MIDQEDITFICSGKIFKEKKLTFKSLRSVRKYFPKSKIILSVAEEYKIEASNLRGLYDKLIISKKLPLLGSTCLPECSWYPKENSYNIQMQQIFTALKLVNTKYVTRFRTDFIFKSRQFLINYERHLKFLDKQPNIFKQRVLIYSCGSIDPFTRNFPMPHHPSDLFFFGLKEDIQKIYDGRLLTKNIANYYTYHRKAANPFLFNHLYTPEQFLWLQLLDKSKIKYQKPRDYLDVEKKIPEETLKLFVENFILLDQPQLDFDSKFKKKFPFNDKNTRFITTVKFIEYYQNVFGSTKGTISLLKEEKDISLINCAKLSLSKHIRRLKERRSIGEILSIFYYLCAFIVFKSKKKYNK